MFASSYTYTVEFLGLPQEHTENDLRHGLLGRMKDFMLELGRDFCFVGSEFPLQVGTRDFALDLLFFHRGLNCLVAMDLLCGRPHNRSSVAQPVMWRLGKRSAMFAPFQYLNAT